MRRAVVQEGLLACWSLSPLGDTILFLLGTRPRPSP